MKGEWITKKKNKENNVGEIFNNRINRLINGKQTIIKTTTKEMKKKKWKIKFVIEK